MKLTPKDFPLITPEQMKGVKETHNLVRVAPNDQKELQYTLLLPKNWLNEVDLGEQQSGIGQLIKMGLFLEPVKLDHAVVQLFYCSMPVEIELLDWLEYMAPKYGTKAIFTRHIECAAGFAVDQGGTYGEGAATQVIRNTAHADGARILMASAIVAQDRYPSLMQDIAFATNSFHLVTPSGSTKLEAWLSARRPNPGFAVAYPSSWKDRPVENAPDGKSAVEMYLAKDDQMLAYVRVKATDTIKVPYDTVESRTEAATREVKKAGITFVSPWEKDNDPCIAMIPGLDAKLIARGSLADNAVELRLGMVSHKPLDFSVSLLSVPREKDPVLWMRSKRAYAIALSTAVPT